MSCSVSHSEFIVFFVYVCLVGFFIEYLCQLTQVKISLLLANVMVASAAVRRNPPYTKRINFPIYWESVYATIDRPETFG